MEPLYQLLKTGMKWSWFEKEEWVSQQLKLELTNTKALVQCDFHKNIYIVTDASYIEIAGYIGQVLDEQQIIRYTVDA